jgi:hypothetical protein
VFSNSRKSSDVPTSHEDSIQLFPWVGEMFDELNNLSILVGNVHDVPPQIAPGDKTSLAQKLDAAERRIHSLMHSEFSDDSDLGGSSYRWRAYPLAGNIFLYLYLRHVPLSSTIFNYVVPNLQQALIETGGIDDTGIFPADALFWMLVMGGVAAVDRVQWQWFRLNITKSSRLMGLNSWHDARKILLQFPFTGGLCESKCQSLWDELSKFS